MDAVATFESAARLFADFVETIPSTAWDGPELGEWDASGICALWSATPVDR